MIERRHEANFFGEEHAIAEDVAAHVADTGNRERVFLRIDAHLVKVPFDGFPGATCRDGHLLVVVTGGTAGRKCVIEPETVFRR